MMNVAHRLPERLRLRVDDYLLLNAAGALAEAGRTELIDGEILKLAPRLRPEAVARMAMTRAIERGLNAAGSALDVLAGVSVAMPPHDCPQVDITVFTAAPGNGPSR